MADPKPKTPRAPSWRQLKVIVDVDPDQKRWLVEKYEGQIGAEDALGEVVDEHFFKPMKKAVAKSLEEEAATKAQARADRDADLKAKRDAKAEKAADEDLEKARATLKKAEAKRRALGGAHGIERAEETQAEADDAGPA